MAPTFERTLVIGKGITKCIVESVFSAAGSVAKGDVVMDIKTTCRSEVIP
jgi:hypothetical protein